MSVTASRPSTPQSKLRKKLSLACGGANYIETVWGRGYVLRDAEDDEMSEPQAAVA